MEGEFCSHMQSPLMHANTVWHRTTNFGKETNLGVVRF